MKKLQRVTAYLLALAICLSVVTIQVSAAPAVSDIDDGIMARWVTGPDGYDDGFGMNGAGGSDKAQKMLNGDRFVRYDNHGFWNARTALPVGSYYFKFLVKIKRGSGTPDEGDRPFFVSIPGDTERTDRSGPILRAFPDNEWVTVTIPFVIGNNLAYRNLEYAIKGAMPWVVGGNDAEVYIGREIVVAKDNRPLVYGGTVASYAMQGGYGDVGTVRGTLNDDKSRTYTGQDSMYNFTASLPAGNYWVKMITKTSGKSGTADLDGEISTISNSGGWSANLPAVGEYINGKWKNVIIPLTITPEQANQPLTYSILGPQNGANDLTIEEYLLICDNDRPLAEPQQEWRDRVIPASQIANGIGMNSNNWNGSRPAFNTAKGYLELKPSLSTDRFFWDLEMKLSRKQFVDSGYIAKGKVYVKIEAKVPTLATSASQNTELFGIELRSGGTIEKSVNFNYGLFTEADTYQTLVAEFDISQISSFGGSGEWTARFDGRYFGDVSDLHIKSITISSNPDVSENMAPAARTYSWPEDQAYPSFGTPADVLDLVDIKGYSSLYYAQMMPCVQGLVNKTKPRIIVAETNEEGEGNGYWLDGRDYWPASMGLNYVKMEGANPQERILNTIYKYRDEFDGFIQYAEGSNTCQIEVATTLSGLYNAIPVTPAILSVLRASPYNMDATRWPVKVDITTAYSYTSVTGTTTSNMTTRTTNSTNAMTYLYNNYRPGLSNSNPKYNDRLVVLFKQEDGYSAIRDVAVATGALSIRPLFNRTSTSAHNTAITNIFTQIRNNHNNGLGAVGLGFWAPEEEGVKFTTSYGISVTPSDNFENYTVYSGMSRVIDPTEVPKKPDLVGGMNYISLAFSDGDNVAYLEHGMRYGQRYGDRTRGYFPLNWTMNPALLDMAPQILQYYYNSASVNDSFIIGPDGLGYTRAESWPSTTVDLTNINGKSETASWINGYAALTNKYVERTGLNIPTIWGQVLNWRGTTSGTHYNNFTQAKLNQYADFNYFPALAGVFHMNPTVSPTTSGFVNQNLKSANSDVRSQFFNFGHYAGDGTGAGAIGNNTQAANNSSTNASVYQRIKGLPQNLAADTNQFHAVQLQNWNGDLTSKANQLIDYSNKNYAKNKFVRADHYFMLMAEANGEPINNALQADTYASASDPGYESRKAVDGSFGKTHGWKSSAAGEQWLTVDFGKRQTITRYVVKNAELAGYPVSYNTKGWELQVSNDGRNWTTIDTVTDNTDATVYRTATSASARFARILITNAGEDGIARIQDIEIYGINNWDRATLTYTVYKDDLNAEIDNFENSNLNQTSYTNESWQTLMNALENAISVSEDDNATQIEVDNATLALRDAIDQVDAIDLTILEAALAEAGTKEQGEYSDTSWAAFQAALAAANAVKAATQTIPMLVTQSQINTAAANLVNAMNALTLDRTELLQAISTANALVESDYSEASWEVLKTSLQKANVVANNLDATRAEITAAKNELIESMAALTVDKSGLSALISLVEEYDSKYYTTSSWNAFLLVLEKAMTTNSSSSAKQSEIDSVTNELIAAQDGLIFVEEIFEAIKTEIGTLTSDDYVAESWNKVTQLLDEMEALLESDDYSHEQINKLLNDLIEATSSLLLAIKNLPSTIELMVGEDITLTPTPDDGEWNWDAEYFEATFNSPATFTALKEGKTVITYTTTQGVTHTINVTIRKADIIPPKTGDEIPHYVFIGIIAGSAGMFYVYKTKRRLVRK